MKSHKNDDENPAIFIYSMYLPFESIEKPYKNGDENSAIFNIPASEAGKKRR